MLEVVRKRRRWPRWALATVGLLIGMPVAWHLRPLNSMERRLVGVWEGGLFVTQHEFVFTPDRRYRRFWLRNAFGDLVTRGSWEISGSQLTMKEDYAHSWERPTRDRVLAYLTKRKNMRVEFVGSQEMRLVEEDGYESTYSRRLKEHPEPEVIRVR